MLERALDRPEEVLDRPDGFAHSVGTADQRLAVGFRRVQVLGQGKGTLDLRDAGRNRLDQGQEVRVLRGIGQIGWGERRLTERQEVVGELGEAVQGCPVLIIFGSQLGKECLPFPQFPFLLEPRLLLGGRGAGAKESFLHHFLPPAETERVEPPFLQVGNFIFHIPKEAGEILQ